GQIQSMGARVIEEIAFDPPGLPVDLLPLGAGINPYLDVLELHGSLTRLDRTGALAGFRRPCLARLPAGGRGCQEPFVSRLVKHLLAVVRDNKAAHAVQQFVGLALAEIELVNGRMGAPAPR